MKGLWVHPRSGIPYYRTRRGGKVRRVPLPRDLPFDHPDFIAAWAAAAKETAAPRAHAAGTIGSTWKAALASDTFAAYSRGYQGIVTRHAKQIIDKAGAVKASAVQPKHIRADLRAATDAGARLKAWRFWASYCIERDWIATDPTLGIKKPAPRDSRGGHRAWTVAEIEAFRAAYPIGSTPRAVMELAYWTGARISDCVKIGPQHVGRADGVLAFQQTKTRDMAYVPWTCALPAYAAGMEADRDLCRAAIEHMRGGLTFLHTASGRARSDKGASQTVSRAARAIGLDGISVHGLRKARAVALAEAGATSSQIGSWTGHRSLSEIEHYTRERDRRAAVIGTRTEQEGDTSLEKEDTSKRKALK